jgi:hypothetical protein
MKRLMQLKSHKVKLDLMDKNIEEVINQIKSEIAVSTKRDTQLVDSKPRSPVMLSISHELSNSQSRQGSKPERESIFVRTESERNSSFNQSSACKLKTRSSRKRS